MTEGIWQAKHSWSVPAFQSCGITPWCISGGASCYEDGHPCFRYSTLEKKYDLKLALDVSQPFKLEMTGVQVEINTGFVLNKKVTEENCCWNRAILYPSAWSCAPLLSFSVCLSICARIAQNPGGNRPRVEYGREAIAFLWRWTKQVKVQVCWGGGTGVICSQQMGHPCGTGSILRYQHPSARVAMPRGTVEVGSEARWPTKRSTSSVFAPL